MIHERKLEHYRGAAIMVLPVRLAWHSLPGCLSGPLLLCTAAEQETMARIEEEWARTEQKRNTPSAEKILMKEKVRLGEQLKEIMEKQM